VRLLFPQWFRKLLESPIIWRLETESNVPLPQSCAEIDVSRDEDLRASQHSLMQTVIAMAEEIFVKIDALPATETSSSLQLHVAVWLHT
jgi:hypothetical protein